MFSCRFLIICIYQVQSGGKKAGISSTEPTPNDATQVDRLLKVDEWQQYPAFPSAYPPTPLFKQAQTAVVTPESASISLYPPVPGEQDFLQSLSLPHDDSNPSHADDRGNDIGGHGVQLEESQNIAISVINVDNSNASDDPTYNDADGYESEDEFNITLRTPDAPLRILTSLGPPLSSEISPLNLPSVSTPTTVDGDTSLNMPSTEPPISEGVPINSSTFVGREKVLQPASTTTNVRVRSSHTMVRGSTRMTRSGKSPVKRLVVSQGRLVRPKYHALSRTPAGLHPPEPENEPPSAGRSFESEESISKRRRVSLSPPTAVQITGPARHRIARVAPKHKISTVRPSTRT